MRKLLCAFPQNKEEVELTLMALGLFFRTLREKDYSYRPNPRFEDDLFEHMIRFSDDEGYVILLTDQPELRRKNNDSWEHSLYQKILKRFSEKYFGNPELRKMIEMHYLQE